MIIFVVFISAIFLRGLGNNVRNEPSSNRFLNDLNTTSAKQTFYSEYKSNFRHHKLGSDFKTAANTENRSITRTNIVITSSIDQKKALHEFDSMSVKLPQEDKITQSKTGSPSGNMVSKPVSTKSEPNFKTVATIHTTSKKEHIEEFFVPQIPLPGEEVFLVIESSNNSQKFVNCTPTNSTETCGETLEHAPQFEKTTMIKVVVLFVIAGLSFIGNIATLTSILRTGRQNTSTVYILLVQLAISDILVATFCLLADALWKITVQWHGGNALCKIVKFMQMFSLYLSTYILVLIGFDRLCAIKFPMARARAKYYVRNGIICIWIISAVFSSPQEVNTIVLESFSKSDKDPGSRYENSSTHPQGIQTCRMGFRSRDTTDPLMR
ncbi:Gonadotropin-releasing hormone receptor [Araneus ventricosus]|uniref:Gonadotropin-releasing hormone receptor n=1 Tax=Araneus ventricosus TaxID=182803 RepID=A0A4Y2E9P9_ARAVE|nr:Gonadotropin-releasing hormone receptor [Araneus ventricosus]